MKLVIEISLLDSKASRITHGDTTLLMAYASTSIVVALWAFFPANGKSEFETQFENSM